MDTRRKIVSAAQAAEAARRWRQDGGKVAVVTGYFDVLLRDHWRELAGVRNGTGRVLLLAVLTPAPAPVLGARARAELVAGLAVVDYVMIAEDHAGLEALLAGLAADILVRDEAVHDRRMRQLIEHVQGRQTGG
jgi:bifunctional ADP-heptose synthase (sugar kinase/adenylyltransferase)